MVSGDVRSGDLSLKVAMKPLLISLEARADYPSYTGMKSEIIHNNGDLTVPVGTRIYWTFEAEHTNKMSCVMGQSPALSLDRKGDHLFQFAARAIKDENYTLFMHNQEYRGVDSVRYQLSVIPDQYPQINVQTFEDSTDNNITYLSGEISDDYGIADLKFNYQITHPSQPQAQMASIKVPFNNGKSSTFRYVLDLNALGVSPGIASAIILKYGTMTLYMVVNQPKVRLLILSVPGKKNSPRKSRTIMRKSKTNFQML